MAEEMRLNAHDWAKGPPGPTWTLLAGDRVLGIGGAIAGEDDGWQAWCCVEPLRPRQWARGLDLAEIVLDHLIAHRGARRIWADCRDGRPGARRLIERLGFRLHAVTVCAALGCHILSFVKEG